MGRLPAATAVVEGPGFPRIDSQACRRSPLSEDTQGSSVGHFFPWSQSVTDKALVAWVCRMGWGVGWSRKHLAPRLKGSLRHQPALPPHTSVAMPVWQLGQGSSSGTERQKCYGHISGFCYTSAPGQLTLCQLLTQSKTLPLVAGGAEGRTGWPGRQLCLSSLAFLRNLLLWNHFLKESHGLAGWIVGKRCLLLKPRT